MTRRNIPLLLFVSLAATSPASGNPINSATDRTFSCGTRNAISTVANGNAAPAVVPGLHVWTGGAGSFQIVPTSRIVVEQANMAVLQPVAKRLQLDLQEITGISASIVADSTVQPGDIALSLTPCNPAIAKQIGNEGYTLSARDNVILRANLTQGIGNNTNGLFYGTRTLLQMLELDGQAKGQHKSIPQGDAIDIPLYAERAVLIDVGRGFVKKESLKAYMKFMGWYKLNRLHLALTGDLLNRTPGPNTVANANFRLFDSTFKDPPLSTDGLYYSRADWDELEDVAAAYGISIVPEINVPAHSQSMARAIDPKSTSESLDLSDPDTLPYVKRVWDQFLPWFRSNRVHIGGDEGDNSVTTQTFLNNVATYLQGKGKTVQMWQDSVSGNSNYHANIVIQNWRTSGPLPWSSPQFAWINSSGSFYVNPNNGAPYEESQGFAGDSFYANDSALGISHPGGETWDWFGNVARLQGSNGYAPIGGQISLWNDLLFHHPYTFEELSHYLFSDAIPAAGQIWWNGQKKDASGNLVPYSTLRASVALFQFGPGTDQVPMFAQYPLSGTLPKFTNPPVYSITPAYPAQKGVLTGLATKYDCKSCGAGEVGGLGTYNNGSGTVTIKVPVAITGSYLLPVYYVSGSNNPFNGQLTINNAAPVTITYPATGGSLDQVAEMGTFVTLQAGTNSIKFSSTTAMGNIAGIGTPIRQP
ncbi:beta-N-acetylhexosaminidase [Xenorhabdus beddingii]|uniref:N-acetyl-beta-glucosaminidase n=1 Tax=Xenorhabdus beddingii TaxID=40578 RepID=A0A1Y2SNX4_9GAMM|nr:family 20 glycosylhydrolase [Xenorhabdus beddingii]OTA19683.1 beta-N-acetylhexosaminidase [Xenorhabdus beddingii]